MSIESVVHRLVDVAAGLDRIGEQEAPALHEAIDAAPAAEEAAPAAPAADQAPGADWRPPGL